ncbi:MAG: DNA-3-methyladenine glycosylase [Thaumarchaeota archaeon 13_1_20CM_2_39_20]|nr:MAG: DNA-3-methyladenine glycosylase [Thaumarchaeota archaeon 13_1_40CM_2_39_13_1]OLE40501.1 MAG: DNA-3-methyladenine glycosylase [Thaumarchaeota archaeon 13_1_20CM_2_39_20]
MNQQDGVRFLLKDPILGKIIDNVGDYSLKRRNHHFAVLVESIISQQLATKAAEAIFRRFTKLYPKFPTATQILATRKSKLRKTGISGMKIDYLKDLARNIEEGKLKIKSLPKMSDEQVIEQLTQIKGIGRWTAEMFLIFSLGRQDVLPVHDLGLRKGVQFAFSLPQLPKPKEVEKFGERWKPYRSIATWYLWKSLQKFDRIG